MKIKELPLYLSFIFFLAFTSNVSAQANGKALFKQNCAACHNPIKDMTGPAIQGARAKWEAAGDDIYAWIKNSQASIDAGVASALAIKDYDATAMPPQAVSNEEIDAILKYADEYVVTTLPPPPPGTPVEGGNESNNSWLMWLIIGGILSMLIVALWGVRKQLYYAVKEKDEGEEVTEEESVKEEVKSWAGRNLKLVSVLGFVIVCALAYYGAEELYKVGLIPEGYNPEQPIAFDHSIHAGTNEIDCQYCHSSASKSKHAGIPSVNVCMNCHKGVNEATSGERGTLEIAKIHEAAGYDPDKRQYTGKTDPIRWVKVHNMPDHVYFNHSQHVTVGKIECENCHGDVKTYKTGRASSTEIINNIKLPNNRKIIKLSKPLMTMGWCIECHATADVSTKDNKYYDEIHERLKLDKELYKSVMEDGKVKVKELGGWECSKCHY
ncbi:MAG: cytochrome c3 family protein [Flavobacteriales bacterium]